MRLKGQQLARLHVDLPGKTGSISDLCNCKILDLHPPTLNHLVQVQEGKAEKAAEAIKAMLAPNAKVLRDGQQAVVPADELVPGDIVLLKSGDNVPADCRLIEATNLQVGARIRAQGAGPGSSRFSGWWCVKASACVVQWGSCHDDQVQPPLTATTPFAPTNDVRRPLRPFPCSPKVQEAMLTGESVPASKSLKPVPASASLGDRKNMVYSATAVVTGQAVGIVVGTGDSAEIGQINKMVGTVSCKQPEGRHEDSLREVFLQHGGIHSVKFMGVQYGGSKRHVNVAACGGCMQSRCTA